MSVWFACPAESLNHQYQLTVWPLVAVIVVAFIIFFSTSEHTGKDGYFKSLKETKTLEECEELGPMSDEWKACTGYVEPEVEIYEGTPIP